MRFVLSYMTPLELPPLAANSEVAAAAAADDPGRCSVPPPPPLAFPGIKVDTLLNLSHILTFGAAVRSMRADFFFVFSYPWRLLTSKLSSRKS